VRRHAREHLWRAPVGGPYRVAVPHAMFEELRSHLAYECFDVAVLPAITSVVGGGSGAARCASAAATGGRARAAPPASTQISAVGQLLGEIRVDERDNEWMYALNRATGDADANDDSALGGPKLIRAQNVGRAAARARAIFLNRTASATADVDHDFAASADVSQSANDNDDSVGESPRAFGGLSLNATNRAFMLAADIMRAAARSAVDGAAQVATLSSSQQQAARRSTAAGAASGISRVPEVSFSPMAQRPTDAVLSGLLVQFERVVEGASPTDGTVCALRHLVTVAMSSCDGV
jgi:hypothetical protein